MKNVVILFAFVTWLLCTAVISSAQSITRPDPHNPNAVTIMPRNPLRDQDYTASELVFGVNEVKGLEPLDRSVLGSALSKKFQWVAATYRKEKTSSDFLHLQPATVKGKETVSVVAALSWIDGAPVVPMMELGRFQTQLDVNGLNVNFINLFDNWTKYKEVHIDLQITRPSCGCVILSRYSYNKFGGIKLLGQTTEPIAEPVAKH